MTSVIDTIDSLPMETSRLTPTLRDWAKLSTRAGQRAALQHDADRAAQQRRRRSAARRG